MGKARIEAALFEGYKGTDAAEHNGTRARWAPRTAIVPRFLVMGAPALLLLLAACGRPSEGRGSSDGGNLDTGDAALADGSPATDALSDGSPATDALSDGSPATDALSDGSPTPGPAGTLVLRIGGTEAAVTYDVLRVGGRANLGGQLVLQFTGGYVPPTGQRFLLVEADGGIAGTFAGITSQGVPVQPGQDTNTFWVTVQ